MIREDIHKLSSIDPQEYVEVLAFAFPWLGAQGIDYQQYLKLRGREKFFTKSNGNGGCDVCGSNFRFGSVYRHVPTGEHIVVGHICALKLRLASDRDAWRRIKKLAKGLSERRKRRLARRAQYREVLSAKPGLGRLLKVDHYIARGIRGRFILNPFYRVPTDKQIDLLKKLKQQKLDENFVPAPVKDGERTTIQGKVVSIKTRENDPWLRIRLTVKINEGDGEWLAWGTLPTFPGSDGTYEYAKVGDVVQFDAKVTISPDKDYFVFFKRPTKAVILKRSAES